MGNTKSCLTTVLPTTISAARCCTMTIISAECATIKLWDGQLFVSKTVEITSGRTGENDIHSSEIPAQQPDRPKRYAYFLPL